jgi:hypothetical protein
VIGISYIQIILFKTIIINSIYSTTLLVFFPTPTWTGIISAHFLPFPAQLAAQADNFTKGHDLVCRHRNIADYQKKGNIRNGKPEIKRQIYSQRPGFHTNLQLHGHVPPLQQ